MPTIRKNTTLGKTRLDINDGMKHDWRNLQLNQIKCTLQNPFDGTFFITSRFEISKKIEFSKPHT